MSWKLWNHQLLWILQIEPPDVPKWKPLTQSTALTIQFSGWHEKGSHQELDQD